MTTSESEGRKITIEPLTRVEGHGKVSIHLDAEGKVEQARLHIVEFRGFERFIQGRPYWEVPVLVQRLCGICPVSHHLVAAKAMDGIVGVDKLPPTAEKIRRLMHYGQFFQSHALHFFHLASPDLLFGAESDPAQRNIVGVARKYPDLAYQGIMMRKFGQEIIKATSGKKIHGTGAVPGGVNRSLTLAERARLLKEVDQMLTWCRSAVKLAKEYTLDNLEELKGYGSFKSNYLSLVDGDGGMELYDGKLRARGTDGSRIFDQVEPKDYAEKIAEEVRPWSYMKFPFLREMGPENGWYRVGPLARINTCDYIDTPQAEAARRHFIALGREGFSDLTMAYHWARMIELLHAVEKIKELLEDPEITGDELKVSGDRRDEAVAIIEAPRGTLFHHYKVDERDQVVMANLIVSTTNNNMAMNRAVEETAREHLSGNEISEGLLNRIEVAIRAYDPCLSCATHALGRMPLVVELFDSGGDPIHRGAR